MLTNLGFNFRNASKKIFSWQMGVRTQQIRNTYVFHRKYPLPAHRLGYKPNFMKHKAFIYDILENRSILPKENINLILTEYVNGIGNVGDKISMKPGKAYARLLVPGLAVYDTPDNEMKYISKRKEVTTESYSSPYAIQTIKQLSKKIKLFYITMSDVEPWILEPWHLRVSFRQNNFIVPEFAITMPPGEIRGPDLSLEDKEFFVVVTINKKETVNIKCRILHLGKGRSELPDMLEKKAPLFPEQAKILGHKVND